MQRSGYLFLLEGVGLQKTHNSHFQMEARYQEHSWTLDSKTFGTYVNESRPKLWVIRQEVVGVWHRGLHAAHVISIPFVQLHTTHTKNITGVQICLFGISMGVTCTLLHVHTKIHVHGISHSGEWPIIFFDARNLNLRAPLIYNLVCPCSLTTSYVILRGKNSCSAVLSCQLGFSRTKKFDSKRNQKEIFRIAT